MCLCAMAFSRSLKVTAVSLGAFIVTIFFFISFLLLVLLASSVYLSGLELSHRKCRKKLLIIFTLLVSLCCQSIIPQTCSSIRCECCIKSVTWTCPSLRKGRWIFYWERSSALGCPKETGQIKWSLYAMSSIQQKCSGI